MLGILERAAWKVAKVPFTGGLASRAAWGAGAGAIVGGVRGDVSGETRFGEVLKHAALGAMGGAALHGVARYGPGLARGAWRGNLAFGRRRLAASEKAAFLAEERAAKAAFPGAVYSPAPIKQGARSNIFAQRVREFGASPLAQGPLGMTRRMGEIGGRGARGVGRFALEHPWITVGGAVAIGGIGAGLYPTAPGGATPSYSPTMTGTAINVNYNQQAVALSELESGGISPMSFMGIAPQFEQFQEQQTYRERLHNSTYGLVQGLNRGRH